MKHSSKSGLDSSSSNSEPLSIGKYIRRLREQKGLTQEQVAESIGIDYTFLGQIERNQKIGSIQTLIKIAKALNIEPPYRIFAFIDSEARVEDLELLDFIYLPANLTEKDKKQVNQLISQLSLERYKQSLEQRYSTTFVKNGGVL